MPRIHLAVFIRKHTQRLDFVPISAKIDLDVVVHGVEADTFIAGDADLVVGGGASAATGGEGPDVRVFGEDSGGGGEEGAEEEGLILHCVS